MRMSERFQEPSLVPEIPLAAAMGRRKMPAQKPGLSKQDYATPKIFIDAVKRRFGIHEFAYDLAASRENTKAKHFFCEEEDSLKQDWRKIRGDAWLNPPYAHIAPWAEKCAASAGFKYDSGRVRQIYFLVPAAVGSNWFAQHVDGKALVLLLNGRISFDGKAPYPKDCILAVFGPKPGYEVWSWAKGSK
jgi:phage N-6-adenine-methyltransferase